MASICIIERADCLLILGRLEEAAATYEEGIRHCEQLGAERDVAVGKSQIGTVRLHQLRYKEALAAYEEARERFTRLDEPHSIAKIWHQIGRVYQEAKQPEAAEDAYRKSLAFKVQIGDLGGQANTLVQLGNLYDFVLNRPEEAVTFYRQAADKYVENHDRAKEGTVRTNLAGTLIKLHRFNEARQEIHQAIECKAPFGHASEPWTSWAILSDLETNARNPDAAEQAKQRAIECYFAYRRDGGENHTLTGRFVYDMTKTLRASGPTATASFLQDLAAEPNLAQVRPFVQALQAIIAGSRDRSLADNPDFDYSMAAEILFLIETLEKPQ